MRIRLESKPAGLSKSFLDAADKTYNQDLLLY